MATKFEAGEQSRTRTGKTTEDPNINPQKVLAALGRRSSGIEIVEVGVRDMLAIESMVFQSRTLPRRTLEGSLRKLEGLSLDRSVW
jgi:hypothetical protein